MKVRAYFRQKELNSKQFSITKGLRDSQGVGMQQHCDLQEIGLERWTRKV